MTEVWKAIPGYPLHEASSLGQVRSIAREVKRKSGRGGDSSFFRPSRIIKPQVSRRAGGRIQAMVSRISPLGDGVNKTVYMHHLVLLAFVGPAPEGMICCHNNGDPTDNRPENLRWDTPESNNADMERHGTRFIPQASFGGESPNSKLSDLQIVEIVESPWGWRGIGNKLADRFGVCNSAIYEARRRYAKRPDLYQIIKRRALCPMNPVT